MEKHLLTQIAIYEDQQYHDWQNEGSMPLRGTDNRVWGRCYVTWSDRDTHTFNCPAGPHANGFTIDGQRRFRCITEVTAKEINDKMRKEIHG